MNMRNLLLCLSSALALGACSQRPYPVYSLDDLKSYTLASGDRLRIIVFGQENLSNIYAVDSAGRISMPLIGAVQVSGQSTTQVERAIEAKLRGGYLREPRVTVEVETYRPFFVLGEVTNSGQFAFVSGMTVQTAIAIAGGYTPRAFKNTVELTRPMPEGPLTQIVPLTFPVRPGDTIMVKERWF